MTSPVRCVVASPGASLIAARRGAQCALILNFTGRIESFGQQPRRLLVALIDCVSNCCYHIGTDNGYSQKRPPQVLRAPTRA
jgi:copper oxidase (laccase) domain-containing protein